MEIILTDENYEEYALRNYNNPQCGGRNEFLSDLENIPKWIKRILGRYHRGGELRESLVLRHLVVFFNVFGIEAATNLIFFKIEKKYHTYIKTFMIYLSYYREGMVIQGVFLDRIPVSKDILDRLEKI